MIPKPSKLNPEEFLLGAILGVIFDIKFRLPTIIIPFFMAYLWGAGGAKKEDGGNKLYRRVGCALLPCLIAFHIYNVYTVFLAFPLAFGAFSIGYGIPDCKDEGSLIGRFWFQISEKMANLYTRLTVWTLILISFIPIWIV